MCERMFHNKKYPKDTKYMGTHCQSKIYGDTLPIQNIWGHIANPKYMGTHCQKIFVWGQIANKQKMGTLYQYCLQKYVYIQNNYHAWHENWSTLHPRQQPRQ